MSQEAISSLQTLAEQLRARLLELPEFRALMVIDRTILELSQILDQPTGTLAPAAPTAPAPAPVAVPAPATNVPAAPLAPPQRAETPPTATIGSQSRMAAAIAATIAARTAPTMSGETHRYLHSLGAAS